MVMRRPGEAREQIDIALKLNPTSHTLYLLSAIFYKAESKCEEGLKECQKIIELNPPNYYSVYYVYFELYRCLGNDLKALESLQKAFSFVPGDVKYISKVKEAYDQSGMTGLLRCWIEQELEDMDKGIMGISQKYAIIGEKKKALDNLEKAFKMNYPGLPNINYDPRFDNIRNEPRFQALLDSMGLAQYQSKMDKSKIAK
jgi:tetratricopeptide (TPR) repeat protein